MITKSIYNKQVKIDNDFILYNTFTRKYIKFNNKYNDKISELMDNINKGQYTLDEFEVVKKFIDCGLIVSEDLNEIHKIKYLENKVKFKGGTYYLVIQPTLSCNFRCVYCYEDHRNVRLTENIISNLLLLVEKVSLNNNKLVVAWFGGEPLLEKDLMLELTNKFKKICEKNNCQYSSCITTNGYLIDADFINNLDSLSIKKVQVTLDGDKDYHDKMRPLINGNGTYDVITQNLRKLSKSNVEINLRINVKDYNYNNIDSVFEIIPSEERHKVNVYLCNVFQEETKLSMYNLYLKALDKGYNIRTFTNTFRNCEANINQSVLINPEGKCAPCSIAAENNFYFGNLDCNGNIDISKPNNFYSFNNFSSCETDNCTKCNQLPMCMGGCKFSKFLDKNTCNAKAPEGLSLDEKILLHYYDDLKRNKEINEVII